MSGARTRCSACGAPNGAERNRCRICGGPLRSLHARSNDDDSGQPSFKDLAEHEVVAWGEYSDRNEAIRARHRGVEGLPGPSWAAVLIALVVGAAIVFAAFSALVA